MNMQIPVRRRSALVLKSIVSHAFDTSDGFQLGHCVGRPGQRLRPHPIPESDQESQHIVVIYQENWSFDSLYGDFPGANGIDNASPESLNQVDRLGVPYSSQLGANNFIRISSAAPQLSTPPQPINNNVSPAVIDTRFLDSGGNLIFNTLLPYQVEPVLQDATRPVTSFIAIGITSPRLTAARMTSTSPGATIQAW